MIETINKLNRISRQMLQEMGREPTPEELAERMLMPEDKIRKVLKLSLIHIFHRRKWRCRFHRRKFQYPVHA